MSTRLSSLDPGYSAGDLSVFPQAIDDTTTLYEVGNNGETRLTQGVSYNGKTLVVDSTDNFPPQGLLRLANRGDKGVCEIIYYSTKTRNTFRGLVRGFAGSRQSEWASRETVVTAGVMAEPQNSLKDAVFNMQHYLGLASNPADGTVIKLIQDAENRFLAPKAIFRGYPRSGKPGLTVKFKSFSTGDIVRYLWDFGDGSTSIEKDPVKTYALTGIYPVTLSIFTSTGGQGFTTKKTYIKVDPNLTVPFFYALPATPGDAISQQEADRRNLVSGAAAGDPEYVTATEFEFVDQTDGEIVQRVWNFDDSENLAVSEPNVHTCRHTYAKPSPSGGYRPVLLIFLADETVNARRIEIQQPIQVK